MLNSKKMLIAIALAALLAVTWLLLVTSKPRLAARQQELLGQASALMQDQIYVGAIPVLQEAETANPKSLEATHLLAQCYQALGKQSDATRVLQGAIDRGVADEATYTAVAQSQLYGSQYQKGLATLKDGMAKLNSTALADLYEQERYRYNKDYTVFEDAGSYSDGLVAVQSGGKWGYITPGSSTGIPFTFDKVTAFDNGYALAIDNGTAVLLDKNGYRNQLCKEAVTDILPLSGGIAGLQINGKWRMTSTTMTPGNKEFDFIGRLNQNRRAVAEAGGWVLYNEKHETVTPVFQEIKTDGQGNAFAMGRAFAKENGAYILIDESGNRVGSDSYEDARPFADGWAAVKQGGKWQFIDPQGTVTMTGEWDEIGSFSCGLAAVSYSGKWGYLTPSGRLVIENLFAAANDFREGVATVQSDGGWCTLQLKEYMK